ncbi:hypothetical protein HN011_001115 [Eciton burchellii]|nr:hypothetical protein HN011_001115 [Eciton burchellii]
MSWPRLFTLLKGLQTPTNIYNLLLPYFKDREVFIRRPECIVREKIKRGCLQDSILGFILWNIYLDDLLGLLEKKESIMHNFTDNHIHMPTICACS